MVRYSRVSTEIKKADSVDCRPASNYHYFVQISLTPWITHGDKLMGVVPLEANISNRLGNGLVVQLLQFVDLMPARVATSVVITKAIKALTSWYLKQ